MVHPVQSVVRAFDILYCFDEEHPTLAAAEVAARLKLNRTTAHRFLLTLERCHAVRRTADRRYSLHPRLLQLASVLLRGSDLHAASLGPMTALRDATGETVALHVYDNLSRLVFMQVESVHELRVTYPRLGEEIPLHLGAPSKAILAFLPADTVMAYLKQGELVGITPNSITSPACLRRELEEIRRRGYAVSNQERRTGVVSIAAPIFDATGAVVAAVNVVAPLSRVQGHVVDEIGERVRATASQISTALGSNPRTRAFGEATRDGRGRGEGFSG